MKVLYVISSLGIGGAEKIATEMAVTAHAQDRTYTIAALTAYANNRHSLLEDAGIPIINLNVLNLISAWKALTTLSRLIRKQKPDVVHGWMYHGCLFALLATYLSGRRNKTRVIWSLRSSMMMTSVYKIQLWFVVRLCRLLSRLPDHTAYNSYRGQDEHCINGFNIRKSSVIPNGVDVEMFKPDATERARRRQELGMAADDLLIGMIARVDPMKGHAVFQKAFAQVQGATAVIAGSGASALPPMDNVILLESEKDVSGLINACDCIVSASLFGEGTSNVILESIACATPVIATDIGDARRLIENTGQIVEPNNPDALARAIQSWVDAPATLPQWGTKARERAVKYYATTLMCEALTQVENGHYDVGL